MKLIKSFIIAFSLYSKIPMPQFEWKEEDMKYVLCFFPAVGAVIGLCLFGWGYVCKTFQMNQLTFLCIGAGISVLITGGFHIDGFMDTMDAVHSYQSRERKLEILKDSHIGAFSVIMLFLYYLIYLGAMAEIKDWKTLAVTGAGFIASRCLSGLGVTLFRPAKKDGLLKRVSDNASKGIVIAVLILELIVVFAGMLFLSWKAGSLVIVLAVGSFIYYRFFCYKEFGGVTGDTAGYFLLVCEAAIMVGVAVGGRL